MVTVAGAGAMGCRFGAALAESGHGVTLLDGWPEHVSAINDSGLKVTDEHGTRTVQVPARLFPASAADRPDLVIVFGKATQTAEVARSAAAVFGNDTLVLTLQNGLGNIEALGEFVPPGRLLAGTTTLGTELLEPGHIRALGSGETVFGALGPGYRRETAKVRMALAEAGIAVRACWDPLATIWSKVAFNCVMNTLCALGSIPVSALADFPAFETLAGSVLDEIVTVAAVEGVTVDAASVMAVMKAQFSPSASGDHLASTLQDLMNGRATEIAHLNGAIAARARSHGIVAPVNETITHLIGLLEATWRRRVNSFQLPVLRCPPLLRWPLVLSDDPRVAEIARRPLGRALPGRLRLGLRLGLRLRLLVPALPRRVARGLPRGCVLGLLRIAVPALQGVREPRLR
jgi:2-dehydropantoate 2-reductase